jgi:hypothetical protein
MAPSPFHSIIESRSTCFFMEISLTIRILIKQPKRENLALPAGSLLTACDRSIMARMRKTSELSSKATGPWMRNY